MLMSSKELRQESGNHEPVYLYDFGNLLNALEWILAHSVENPATVLPVDFTFFSVGYFLILTSFYANRNIKYLSSTDNLRRVSEKLLVHEDIYIILVTMESYLR